MEWDSVKIKELRKRLGWSFSDLARRIDDTSMTIVSLENGELLPTPEQVQIFDVLQRQADGASFDVSCAALADHFFEQTPTGQVDRQELSSKLNK